MKPIKVKANKLKLNPDNPRIIKGTKFKKLVKSIKEFPEMLKLRPIVVDENNIILGGNMRYKASLEIGLKEVYAIQVDDLTEKQKKEFIIKDNVGFGEWDWESLANTWEIENLKEWAMDLPHEFAVRPEEDELTEDFKEKDAKITITFQNIEDLQKAEIDIKDLIDNKYPKAYFSVNGGIL